MSRFSELLTQALLRPVYVMTLGVGLLLALTAAPWWIFPVSVMVYAAMVFLTVRDPAFAERIESARQSRTAGAPPDWKRLAGEFGHGSWTAPLARIAMAEQNLAREFAQSSKTARSVLGSTLAQVRSAATLGIQLAQRLRSLDETLAGSAGMNSASSRREAAEKRARAASTQDKDAQRAFEEAADALDVSASAADSLRQTRERTAAQLESLSAVLESVAVRGIRLRVQSDTESGDAIESLGVEMDAVRETLGVFESMDDVGPTRSGTRGE